MARKPWQNRKVWGVAFMGAEFFSSSDRWHAMLITDRGGSKVHSHLFGSTSYQAVLDFFESQAKHKSIIRDCLPLDPPKIPLQARRGVLEDGALPVGRLKVGEGAAPMGKFGPYEPVDDRCKQCDGVCTCSDCPALVSP